MLAELESPVQRAWLIGLLIAWAALLFGGLLRRAAQPDRAGRMPVQTRILSSVMLAVAAWSWVWFSRDTAAAGYALWIAAGMTLGFVGDLFMARLLPVCPHVLAGMGAFALGHLAYITAGLRYGAEHGLDAALPRFTAWAAWLLIGGLGWRLIAGRSRKMTALHWAALPYSLLLASTAGVATGLALQSAAFVPFALGSALFLFSDLLIALGLFSQHHFARVDDLIWLTYGPGQMLIVYSVGMALAVS